MFWILLAFLLILIIAGMLWNIRIQYNVIVRNKHCKVRVRVAVFFKLVQLPIDIKIEYSPSNGILIMPLKGKFLWRMVSRPWKVKTRRAGGRPKWLKMVDFKVYGNIGLKDDSFVSVLLCGILECLLKTAAIILLQADQISVSFLPDFEQDAFRLNLEGIFLFLPLQIIGVLLKNLSFTRRKAKSVTSN